jgi:hypothetical protein
MTSPIVWLLILTARPEPWRVCFPFIEIPESVTGRLVATALDAI